jgi:fucose permease
MSNIKAETIKLRDNFFIMTMISFFSFIIIGFIDNIKGTSLSGILLTFNINYTAFSLLSLIGSVSYFITCILSEYFSKKLGNKRTLILSCIALTVGLVFFSFLNNVLFFIISMPLISLGIGNIQVLSNSMITKIYPLKKGKYLNLLNFSYSAGAMVGPLYAGKIINIGLSWQVSYFSAIVMAVILLTFFLTFNFNLTNHENVYETKVIDFDPLKNKFIYYIIISIYVMAEMGIGLWLVEFLEKSKSLSIIISSIYLSCFLGFITFGRFFGSFIIEKFKYTSVLLFASISSCACIIIGILGPVQVAWLLPLTGLFFSIIYPTLAAILSGKSTDNNNSAFGLMMLFSGFGSMLGPFLIGIISGATNIGTGFKVVGILIIIMTILMAIVHYKGQSSYDN